MSRFSDWSRRIRAYEDLQLAAEALAKEAICLDNPPARIVAAVDQLSAAIKEVDHLKKLNPSDPKGDAGGLSQEPTASPST